MKIIVGLGNPTEEYANTFHNMGFMTVERLADKLNKKIKKAECAALTGVFSRNGEKVVLAKPLTYMNLSGEAVKSLMAKYKAAPEDVIVIFDDFDLPRYKTRARESGSGGSHNGMKSVISETGSTNIKRIRIGIGDTDIEKRDYVLSRVAKEDTAAFSAVFDKVADAIIKYLDDGNFEELMRTIN